MTEITDFWVQLHEGARNHVTFLDNRIGQAYFNALYKIRPDIANAISATENDPYYVNDRLPLFFTAIAKHLDA
jgi:hypothetical protein